MWGTIHRPFTKEGRFSTAHVYQNALFSFNKFCGNASVSFRQVTRDRCVVTGNICMIRA